LNLSSTFKKTLRLQTDYLYKKYLHKPMSHPQARLMKCLTIILIMTLSTATTIETMYRKKEAALGIWYSNERFDVNSYPTQKNYNETNVFCPEHFSQAVIQGPDAGPHRVYCCSREHMAKVIEYTTNLDSKAAISKLGDVISKLSDETKIISLQPHNLIDEELHHVLVHYANEMEYMLENIDEHVENVRLTLCFVTKQDEDGKYATEFFEVENYDVNFDFTSHRELLELEGIKIYKIYCGKDVKEESSDLPVMNSKIPNYKKYDKKMYHTNMVAQKKCMNNALTALAMAKSNDPSKIENCEATAFETIKIEIQTANKVFEKEMDEKIILVESQNNQDVVNLIKETVKSKIRIAKQLIYSELLVSDRLSRYFEWKYLEYYVNIRDEYQTFFKEMKIDFQTLQKGVKAEMDEKIVLVPVESKNNLHVVKIIRETVESKIANQQIYIQSVVSDRLSRYFEKKFLEYYVNIRDEMQCMTKILEVLLSEQDIFNLEKPEKCEDPIFEKIKIGIQTLEKNVKQEMDKQWILLKSETNLTKFIEKTVKAMHENTNMELNQHFYSYSPVSEVFSVYFGKKYFKYYENIRNKNNKDYSKIIEKRKRIIIKELNDIIEENKKNSQPMKQRIENINILMKKAAESEMGITVEISQIIEKEIEIEFHKAAKETKKVFDKKNKWFSCTCLKLYFGGKSELEKNVEGIQAEFEKINIPDHESFTELKNKMKELMSKLAKKTILEFNKGQWKWNFWSTAFCNLGYIVGIIYVLYFKNKRWYEYSVLIQWAWLILWTFYLIYAGRKYYRFWKELKNFNVLSTLKLNN